MIIDLILDRRDYEKDIREGYDSIQYPNGEIVSILYDPKKFYNNIVRAGKIGEDIARALDSGTEDDVKKALCDYIDNNDYNPGIKRYINSRDWLTPDTIDSVLDEIDIMSSRNIHSRRYVKSSYNPYGTDFKWYEERIVLYYDGENHNLPKYTGNYEDNTVVIQPEYYERADMLVWFVYLNNKKLEGFETSYDALDFAQFELVDMYITPIRSSKRVPKRKIVSAIDLRRKQDFVDAYMDAYGVTKTEAFKAFKDCVNRGDESYIDEIISGFKGNSRKSFYED